MVELRGLLATDPSWCRSVRRAKPLRLVGTTYGLLRDDLIVPDPADDDDEDDTRQEAVMCSLKREQARRTVLKPKPKAIHPRPTGRRTPDQLRPVGRSPSSPSQKGVSFGSRLTVGHEALGVPMDGR